MPRPKKQSPPARSPKNIDVTKKCFSCKTTSTPYWRDSWKPGKPLCNACGLRFSKYKKYCNLCNSIGVKANFERLSCPTCKTWLD